MVLALRLACRKAISSAAVERVSVQVSTAQESELYTLGFTEPYLLGRDLRFDLDLGLSESDSSYSEYDTKRVFLRRV